MQLIKLNDDGMNSNPFETINTYQAKVSDGTYGVSCILPRLQDIIDYEEKRRLPVQGYPRFIPHPFVAEIQKRHKQEGKAVFALQYKEAVEHLVTHFIAPEMKDFCQIEAFEATGNHYAILSVNEAYSKTVSEDIANAGIILNARKAYRIINQIAPNLAQNHVIEKLCRLEKGTLPGYTWLYNSGMAAIYAAITSFLQKGNGAVVIGSCYTDTYKIFEKLPQRFHYQPTVFLKKYEGEPFPEGTGLVFLEIPTNPLLEVENLQKIVEQAHKVGALVMVDSTIASPWHYSPFEYGADIVVHSTTKSLSGKNNHLGGVVFVNPDLGELAERIIYQPFAMDDEEAGILDQNLDYFKERVTKMEKNASKIVEYLSSHFEIEKVYYPRNLKRGNGHIISFRLKNETFLRARAFYDNCTIVTKGPSMGFEKSMVMPYSLMTRYDDTDETLAQLDLSRFLMRLSVGTENASDIIRHLANGLNAVKRLNN